MSSLSTEEQVKKLKQPERLSDQISLNFPLECDGWDKERLIRECIERLFKMNNDKKVVDRLAPYFKRERLEVIYAKVKLLQGEDIKDIDTILSTSEIKELKEKKEITILPKTKKCFDVDEDIVLRLKVKNINLINVKVYEVNLEKMFLLEKREIDPTENLAYLHPSKSEVYEVENNKNPFKENYFDLTIPEAVKKRAAYIVDLESESMSSRAYIRKGGITFISRVTTNGV